MGGTASLYISEYIHDSLAFAINPQLDIDEWSAFKKIKREQSLSSKTVEYRTDWKRIISQKYSKHIVAININSKDDLITAKQISDYLGMSLDHCFNKKESNAIWLYSAEKKLAPSGDWGYHSSLDYQVLFPYISTILKKIIENQEVAKDVIILDNVWRELSFLNYNCNRLSVEQNVTKNEAKALYSYAMLNKEESEPACTKAYLLSSSQQCYVPATRELLTNYAYYNLNEEDLEIIFDMISTENIPSDIKLKVADVVYENKYSSLFPKIIQMLSNLSNSGDGGGLW